jgi:hypothetical protein
MSWTEFDLRRAGAAFVVLLLHVSIVLILWHLTVQSGTLVSAPRELVFRLWRLPPPAPAKPALPAPPVPVIVPLPRTVAPITPPPTSANGSNVNGLHQWLFNCAPDNLDRLTPEQRSQCALRALSPNSDDSSSVLNLPSRAHDAPHWQRALARKQAPPLLPCASPAGLALTPLTVICAANGVLNGFGDLDEQPGYGDSPGVAAHVPNNGDPANDPLHH